jgi:hypothetical protein
MLCTGLSKHLLRGRRPVTGILRFAQDDNLEHQVDLEEHPD